MGIRSNPMSSFKMQASALERTHCRLLQAQPLAWHSNCWLGNVRQPSLSILPACRIHIVDGLLILCCSLCISWCKATLAHLPLDPAGSFILCSSWTILIPERPGIAIEDLQKFEDHVVLLERHGCCPGISLVPLNGSNKCQRPLQPEEEGQWSNWYSTHILYRNLAVLMISALSIKAIQLADRLS